MTRDELASLMRRRTETFNRHDLAALSDLYSADCSVESPLAAGHVQGRHAVAKVYQALFEGFPDVTLLPELTLIEGDTVCVSGWLTGTYTGGFMGLEPSGKPVRVPVVTISTIADGEIVKERRVYDFTGMLVQAGVLKARSS